MLTEQIQVYGDGLLPATFGRECENAVAVLAAAYQSVLGNGMADWKLWEAARQNVKQVIRREYEAAGLEAPPWFWDALVEQIAPRLPASDGIAHVRFVSAMLTPYNGRVCEQFLYRVATGGNVHVEYSGPPGLGKSSCAIGLADWARPIDPARLVDQLAYDLTELPRKLDGKLPGETVLLDEYIQTAGEGSRTQASVLDNLQDTLRGTKVHLFALSPRRQNHGTMQATFDVIAWNPSRQYSLFVVWVGDIPMGVAALPWCRKALWDAYSPWKEENLRRTMRAAFRDDKQTARNMMACFNDKRFVAYLSKMANKPKKVDFKAAMALFSTQMMTRDQADHIASFAHDLCHGFDRLEDDFLEWFEIEPSEGFKQVAAKCYKE